MEKIQEVIKAFHLRNFLNYFLQLVNFPLQILNMLLNFYWKKLINKILG